MIEQIIIYTPTREFNYKVGAKNELYEVKAIQVRFRKITITFSDGYKIVYKGLPYSVEVKK